MDPLPERIADAFADLIFGGRLQLRSHDDSDQTTLEGLADENDLSSELQRAEAICSSEGEVWWRIVVDQEAALHPMVEWYSRRQVVPLWRGRKLAAVAFHTDLEVGESTVWRYVEIHTDGLTRNLLYEGNRSSLGSPRPLSARSETSGLREDDWLHGVEMLAGRVPNRLGRDPRLGISDYAGVRDLLFALNEAAVIGQENARLTLKRRAIVPREYLDESGGFPAGDDVLVDEALSGKFGSEDHGPFRVLEYSFDAEALIAYKNDLTDTILTRCRVAPQLVGRGVNQPESGSALRARMLDTVLASEGKARYWDDQLPKILMRCQLLDAMAEEQGGFGREWSAPGELPAIERGSALPEDESEESSRIVGEVAGEIKSRRQAIKERTDWSDERIDEELAEIDRDRELPQLAAPEDGRVMPSSAETS